MNLPLLEICLPRKKELQLMSVKIVWKRGELSSSFNEINCGVSIQDGKQVSCEAFDKIEIFSLHLNLVHDH